MYVCTQTILSKQRSFCFLTVYTNRRTKIHQNSYFISINYLVKLLSVKIIIVLINSQCFRIPTLDCLETLNAVAFRSPGKVPKILFENDLNSREEMVL